MRNIREHAAWSFETPQFFIGFYAEPEYDNPADHFDLESDVEAIKSGSVEWFCAIVRVYFKDSSDEPSDWIEVSRDVLGCCAYDSVREFFTSHRDPDAMNRNSSIMRSARGNVSICHYFPGMVHEAIANARERMAGFRQVRLRA